MNLLLVDGDTGEDKMPFLRICDGARIIQVKDVHMPVMKRKAAG